MRGPDQALVVRRCGLGDAWRLGELLELCWHAAYDRLLGRPRSLALGRRAYAKLNMGLWIAHALVSRVSTVLLATRGGVPLGLAIARRDDAAEIVLYALYVHPEWQGKGVGSRLLRAVIDRYPEAKAIRLEVLKDNAAAIAWYRRKGFEAYGETATATGMSDVPALYMDKRLDATSSAVQRS